MKSKTRLYFIFALMLLALIANSCRKDISLPDPSLESLFGTWNWVQTSGGNASQITTPANQGYTQSIEFDKDGIFRSFVNGKKSSKLKFSLSTGTSIYKTGTAYLLTFTHIGSTQNLSQTPESVWFSTSDSLFLKEETSDGYQYVYTRN